MKVQELLLGIGIFLWGCLLLALPQSYLKWPDLADLITILPHLDDPALIYAVLAWMTGGAQIVGALTGHSGLQRGSAIAAFTVWAFFACSLISQSSPMPATAAYATLSLLNIRAALGRNDHA
ncbi:hypothetical protein [Asaia astilbis]|uniref:hypothetical protein n=1 Tax=Asaia astilbis TaxID=610244 RepID=UPI000AFB0249|nr:hypothetical protein [Asaia astilbis]